MNFGGSNTDVPPDPYAAYPPPRRPLPLGVRVVLAVVVVVLATVFVLTKPVNLIGSELPWLWWKHTNATVLQCQEIDVPIGRGLRTSHDHCVVAWSQPRVVWTPQGEIFENITDQATLEWVSGAHPAGSTVAIATHGTWAATVESVTRVGGLVAYLLVVLVTVGGALLIQYGWRRRRRRTRRAMDSQPHLYPPLA